MLGLNNPANTETTESVPPPQSKIIAMLLSLCLLGGTGQLYLGQKKKGGLLIIISAVTSCVGLDFIVLIFCAIDAYYTAEKLEKGQTVGEMEWFWQKTTVTTPPIGEYQAMGDDNLVTTAAGDDQTVGSNRVIITPVRDGQAAGDDNPIAPATGDDQAVGVARTTIIPSTVKQAD